MKTTIESLTNARQIAKEGRTFIEDCNCTIVIIDDFGYKYYVTKHDYVSEANKFKTFKGAWNYIYTK